VVLQWGLGFMVFTWDSRLAGVVVWRLSMDRISSWVVYFAFGHHEVTNSFRKDAHR
jgi:hypothetical protein